MEFAVQAENLVKNFGEVKALNGLSFEVKNQEIYGLIGPNGAGKTTALRIVSTLLLPNSGAITVFGRNVVHEAAEVRQIISYLPEEAGSYKNLSGLEYLEFMAKFTGKSQEAVESIMEDAAEISGLGERLKHKTKTYSKGMKRRLLVARALMTKPKLAVLDEPTAGLDVLHSYHVRQIIKQHVAKHKVSVLLSSHNMLEVEYLCGRVALMNKGRIIAEGNPADLKDKFNAENLEEVFAEVVGLV
jgi:ABC-2 type transport system ATP-binding protein